MSEDEPAAPYNNSHRALLQVFFARPTLTFQEARPILASILSVQDGREVLDNDVTEADWVSYVSSINSAVSSLDYEIRSTIPQSCDNPAPPHRIYSLVNTTSDHATQLATTHTPDEINFVKRVLDAMFETYNTHREEVMAITSLQALRLNRPSRTELERLQATQPRDPDDHRTQLQQTQALQNQGLTKTDAQKVLDSMVAEEWFELSPKGYYSLSPRALMELRGWLMDTYNEDHGGEDDDDSETGPVLRIRACHACREIVTVGQRCRDLDCDCRMHDRCVGKVFRAQQNQQVCPVCRKGWDGETFVGERAAKENQTRRRSTNAGNA